MNNYAKSFKGTRLDVENAINEEAQKKKARIGNISAFYVNGVFYAYVVFEKERATSDRKRKATD